MEEQKTSEKKRGRPSKKSEEKGTPAQQAQGFKSLFRNALAKEHSIASIEEELKSLSKDESLNLSPVEFFNELLEAISEFKEKLTKPKQEKLHSVAMAIFAEFYMPKDEGKGLYKALFFPNKENEKVLVEWLRKAQKTLDVCVFTITNNQLADAMFDAHLKGVKVRIISDDECTKMLGSDVHELCEAGLEVTIDSDPHAHMHNKFAIIDQKYLINGSFNWTTQAVCKNNENVTITDNSGLIQEYQNCFEKLWEEFKGNKLTKTGNLGKRYAEKMKTLNEEENGKK